MFEHLIKETLSAIVYYTQQETRITTANYFTNLKSRLSIAIGNLHVMYGSYTFESIQQTGNLAATTSVSYFFHNYTDNELI